MSVAKFGRTLWRGVQKAIKTVAYPQTSIGVQNPKACQIICQHAKNTFGVESFAAQAKS